MKTGAGGMMKQNKMKAPIRIRVLASKRIWRFELQYCRKSFYLSLWWYCDLQWWEQRQKWAYMVMKPLFEIGDVWK
jgi:hypothetical protein